MSRLRKLMTENLDLRGLAQTTIKDYIRQVAKFAEGPEINNFDILVR